MNVLLSLIGTVYDDGTNLYTTQNILAQINRYEFIGNKITVLIRYEHTNSPVGEKIDFLNGRINFIYIKKINSIKSLIIDNRANDKTIHQAVKQADICICHLPCSTSEQTIKYARKLGKPYLNVIVGCPWDSLWNYDWRGKLMAPISYFSLKKIQQKATHSIYVTKTFLQSRYPTFGKQIGVSDVLLEPTSQTILNKRIERLKRMRENCRSFSLATAAGIIPYKGQRFVIEAISELKKKGYEYTYHIIGAGDQTPLKNLAKKLNVENQVIFHGLVNHDKVSQIFDSIDIYIQPSLQEGLPRSMVEAMSRGCVAMGSNIAGIPELVQQQYLFPKKDVNAIVKILSEINRNTLIEMSKYNFNKAKEYDTDLLQKKVHHFLAEFAAQAVNMDK